ncbi:hypothetical protein BLA29_012400 [Euroglyphus maynei]|uniref:Uncharacterized protein n=1 Tax=Euroglyphus maynei TaxID=6958 RepID=A0A1Y3BHM4_EURMA|nr:hypothetical protein BLA29_012400 [Euroglyphus maynei]
MQRTDGLVQRRVASSASANNLNKENEDNNCFNGEFDSSSKGTRLTLMEEVLLLGLKDKEVNEMIVN